MSGFCDSHRSVMIAMSRSVIAAIDSLIDRRIADHRITDRRSHIAVRISITMCCLCDVAMLRHRILAVGDSFRFVIQERSQYMRCDIAFRELNTKILIKIFFEFFVKGPPLLDVIANTKQRGGLLVTTTH